MNSKELLEIGEKVVSWAGKDEQLEVVVADERDTEVRAYDGEVESFTSANSRGAGIRVISDHRQGFAYAGSLDEDVLLATLEDARDNAKFATKDEHLGLAEPDGTDYLSLDLHRDTLEDFSAEEKIDLALRLEKSVREGDKRIIGVESADYSDRIATTAIVSTSGIRFAETDTSCYVSAYSIAQEDGDTQTGFGFSVGREPADLDVDEAGKDAVERATRLLGATKPRSKRMAVLLDPWVSAQFLGVLGGTLSAESVIKGRSLFANSLEEKIAPDYFSLTDDPTNIASFTAGEADGEGLATRRNVMIENGVLKTFAHNSYTARRLGTTSTASAVRGVSSTPGAGCVSLSVAPGQLSQEELVSQMKEGVLIQSVFGLHSGVNPVSGDFSCGAEGIRIKDGSLAEPLKEFTIASTIQKLLLDISHIGSDICWLPMSAAGVSLLISEVTVSGD